MLSKPSDQGNVAEWSKALALGASPKGRGFEPHRYHILLGELSYILLYFIINIF